MKFSVGDKVLVKQTKEEGKVIQIIDASMVEIEVLNTRFPAFVDELDHPYLEWFKSKKINNKKKALSLDDFPAERPDKRNSSAENNNSLETGFYFSIIPVYFFDATEEQLSRLKLYFINQTEYPIKLKYDCLTALGKEFTLVTTLYPFQHLYLHHIRFDLINERLSFNFNIESIDKPEAAKKLTEEIKIKPKIIFQKLFQLKESGQAMIPMMIAKDFPVLNLENLSTETLFGTKPKISNTYQFVKRKPKSQEIDLHIENLLSDYHHLSNHQKIEAQLQACEQAITDAYHNQMPSIIIIHGIGNGTLKESVHQLMKSMKKMVRHFENKYSQKYGFGATEVFLRY